MYIFVLAMFLTLFIPLNSAYGGYECGSTDNIYELTIVNDCENEIRNLRVTATVKLDLPGSPIIDRLQMVTTDLGDIPGFGQAVAKAK